MKRPVIWTLAAAGLGATPARRLPLLLRDRCLHWGAAPDEVVLVDGARRQLVLPRHRAVQSAPVVDDDDAEPLRRVPVQVTADQHAQQVGLPGLSVAVHEQVRIPDSRVNRHRQQVVLGQADGHPPGGSGSRAAALHTAPVPVAPVPVAPCRRDTGCGCAGSAALA